MSEHKNRDAITGRFVTNEVARERPETTVRETVRPTIDAALLGRLLAARIRRNGQGPWTDGYQAAADDVDRWLASGPTAGELARVARDTHTCWFCHQERDDLSVGSDGTTRACADCLAEGEVTP